MAASMLWRQRFTVGLSGTSSRGWELLDENAADVVFDGQVRKDVPQEQGKKTRDRARNLACVPLPDPRAE